MSLIFKDYKINHIALLFIKVLTLSQKQLKIQNSVPSISRTYYSIDRKMKKFITKVLPRSIDFQFLLDWSKSTFDRLKGIFDRSKLAKTKFFQNFTTTVFDIFIILPSKTTFDFINEDLQIKTLGLSISRSRTIIMLEMLKT